MPTPGEVFRSERFPDVRVSVESTTDLTITLRVADAEKDGELVILDEEWPTLVRETGLVPQSSPSASSAAPAA